MTRSQMRASRWWRRGLAVAALLLAGSPLGAQPSAPAATATAAASPVPAERFFQRPVVLSSQLSPSGQRVAINTSRGGKRVGLVVLELLPTPHAVRVADFDDADVVSFSWASDDRLVFVMADLEAGSGEGPGLFGVNADGTGLRMLVKRRGSLFARGGYARDDALDPNHVLLHVPLQQEGVQPDDVVIGEFTPSGLVPKWLNVRTGRTRLLPLDGAPSGAVGWWFDSKGQPRLVQTQVRDKTAIYWHGPADTEWRALAQGDLLTLPFTPQAVDDAGTLYVTHPDGPEGLSVLTRYDFTAMAPETPSLMRTPGFDFSGGVVLDRAGSRALGVRVITDAQQTVWFDEGMRRLQAVADERLPGRVNTISCRRCGAPDMTALVYSYSDRDPGRLWLFETATRRWHHISAVMDEVDPARMAAVDLRRITARDGRELPVWLTLPPGMAADKPPAKPLPAVVLVHGGPWVRGGFWQWEPMAQFLASRGYLVISPEFRGSTGYGSAHYRAGWKQWGQAMQDDVADALRWAQDQGLASKRACIAGGSYGGYAALMGLVRHPALYRCGAAWSAVTDPVLMLKGAFWLDDGISAATRAHRLPELVGDVDKDAALLAAASPLAQARLIKAPLLLAVGEEDRRVPPAHSERLRDALKEAGQPPEWVSYAKEGHTWRLPANRVDFAKRLEQFLVRHLAAEAP